MKKACKLLTIFLLAITLCVFGNLESVNAKSKIKISNSKITLTVGQSKTLKVKGTKKKPKWSSSKKSCSTVSNEGEKLLLRKQEARLSQLRLERKNINVKLKLVKKTTLIQSTEVHI